MSTGPRPRPTSLAGRGHLSAPQAPEPELQNSRALSLDEQGPGWGLQKAPPAGPPSTAPSASSGILGPSSSSCDFPPGPLGSCNTRGHHLALHFSFALCNNLQGGPVLPVLSVEEARAQRGCPASHSWKGKTSWGWSTRQALRWPLPHRLFSGRRGNRLGWTFCDSGSSITWE